MKMILTLVGFLLAQECMSQTKVLSLSEAIAEALQHNPAVTSSRYEVESRRQMQRSSFDLPKTEVMLMYGQYNSYAKNDNNITITQQVPFTAFGSQAALNKALTRSSELQSEVKANEIVYQVRQTYYQLLFANEIHNLYLRQDSIFAGFSKSASARYRSGESTLLEHTTADAQRSEGIIQLKKNLAEKKRLQTKLMVLLGSEQILDISDTSLTELPVNSSLDSLSYKSSPSLAWMDQQVEVAARERKLQAAKLAPDLLLGFFSQTLIGVINDKNGEVASSGDRLSGFQVGLAIPIWFAPHTARVKAAEYMKRSAENDHLYFQRTLAGQLDQVIEQIRMGKNMLEYYNDATLPNAERILAQSQIAFREGEIDYTEYLLQIRNALGIKENFLRTLNDYNQNIIYYEYLTGTSNENK